MKVSMMDDETRIALKHLLELLSFFDPTHLSTLGLKGIESSEDAAFNRRLQDRLSRLRRTIQTLQRKGDTNFKTKEDFTLLRDTVALVEIALDELITEHLETIAGLNLIPMEAGGIGIQDDITKIRQEISGIKKYKSDLQDMMSRLEVAFDQTDDGIKEEIEIAKSELERVNGEIQEIGKFEQAIIDAGIGVSRDGLVGKEFKKNRGKIHNFLVQVGSSITEYERLREENGTLLDEQEQLVKRINYLSVKLAIGGDKKSPPPLPTRKPINKLPPLPTTEPSPSDSDISPREATKALENFNEKIDNLKDTTEQATEITQDAISASEDNGEEAEKATTAMERLGARVEDVFSTIDQDITTAVDNILSSVIKGDFKNIDNIFDSLFDAIEQKLEKVLIQTIKDEFLDDAFNAIKDQLNINKKEIAAIFAGTKVGSFINPDNGGVGNEIGGAIGGLIGKKFGGPVGGFIGSTLGSAIGGLFGGGKSDRLEGVKINLDTGARSEFDLGPKKHSDENRQKADKFAQDIVTFIDRLEAASGGKVSFPGGSDFSIGVGDRDGITVSFGSNISRTFKTIEEAWDFSVEHISNSLTNLPEDVREAIRNIDFKGDVERALGLVDIAVNFEDIIHALNEGTRDIAETARGAAKAEAKDVLDFVRQFKEDTAEIFPGTTPDSGNGIGSFPFDISGLGDIGVPIDLSNWRDFIPAANDATDAVAELSEESLQAEAATRAYVTSLFKTKEPVSEIQNAVDQLNARFDAFTEVFDEVGISAQEATRLLNEAKDEMRSIFDRDLQALFNDVSGKGYLNNIAAVFEQYRQLTSDAAALEHSSDTIDATFFAQLTNIFESLFNTAENGGAFKEILSALTQTFQDFPEIAGAASDALDAFATDMEVTFRRNLHQIFNEVSGRGFLNDINEVLAQRQNRQADADAFGIDTEYIDAIFDAELATILDSIIGAADDIDDAQQIFRNIETEFSSYPEIVRAAADALDDFIANSALIEYLDKEIESLEEQIQLQETLKSNWESIVSSVQSARSRLFLDPSISRLSAEERAQYSLQELEDAFAAAQSGDVDAAAKISQLALDAAEANAAFFASSEDFARVNKRIEFILDNTESVAERQLDVLQDLLDANLAQLEVLREERQNPTGAVTPPPDENPTVLDQLAALNDRYASELSAFGGPENQFAMEDAFFAIEQELLGLIGQLSDVGRLTSDYNNLYDSAQQDTAIGHAHGRIVDAIAARLLQLGEPIPSRATGGMVNGLAIVHPGELLYTGPPARVFNAGESTAALARSGDLIVELRSTRRAIESLSGTVSAANDDQLAGLNRMAMRLGSIESSLELSAARA